MKNILQSLVIIVTILSNFVYSDLDFQIPRQIGMSSKDPLFFLLSDSGGIRHLNWIDTDNKIQTAILPGWDIEEFAVSKDYQLAFSSSHDGIMKSYLLEFPYEKHQPVVLDDKEITSTTRFTWSTDGRFLAYTTNKNQADSLLIWDGKFNNSVHTSTGSIAETTWSQNGQLAFTDFGKEPSHPEIYIWSKGSGLANLSQNPNDDDRYPAWSSNGKLAYLAETENGFNILIWNGKRNRSGQPDTRANFSIPASFISYYSVPAWTNQGLVSFSGIGTDQKHSQIYLWDGKNIRDISHMPESNNLGQSWNTNGEWAFTTAFSTENLVYVLNNKNVVIYYSTGQYAPAWSSSNRLVFCKPNNNRWILMTWEDGTESELVAGQEIEARWPNNSAVYCTNG
jgi:hypothetical protein